MPAKREQSTVKRNHRVHIATTTAVRRPRKRGTTRRREESFALGEDDDDHDGGKAPGGETVRCRSCARCATSPRGPPSVLLAARKHAHARAHALTHLFSRRLGSRVSVGTGRGGANTRGGGREVIADRNPGGPYPDRSIRRRQETLALPCPPPL